MAKNTDQQGAETAAAGGFDKSVFDRRYRAALKATRMPRKDFWMNDSFIKGFQWVHYNPVLNYINEASRAESDDRVRLTINRMWPLSRSLAADLNQRELGFEVYPSKADDATIRAARTSEAILEDVRTNHDWENLRHDLTWALLKGGTAAICIDWDTDSGDWIGDDEEAGGTALHTGDSCETVLNISEFVIQPGAKVAEKANWWIKITTAPPEEVQAEYNLPKLPPADANSGLSPLMQKLASTDGSELQNLTLVMTYYERPNKMCAKGRLVTVINGEIVGGVKDWPFPWKDRLNLSIFRETPVSTQWWGQTVLSMGRPVQVAFNLAWSSIIEHVRKTGNAKLGVSQSNIDLMEEMTDEIGEMVPYLDGTQMPAWINPAQLPSYIQEIPQQLSAQLDDIFGVHDVSRGVAPVNAPDSGYGLSLLAENDTSPLGLIIKDMARGFGHLASMLLKLYEVNVTEPRDAIVRAPGLPAMTTSWTGEDLLGQTDAMIPVDKIMPRSHVAMAATADKLVQMGMITSIAQYVHVAESPNQRDLLAVAAPDVEKARRENHDMRLGRVRIPAKFDDHATHIGEHNIFRKSLEYSLLDHQLQEVFDNHVQAHEMLAAELMGQQQQRAQMSPAMAAIPNANGAPTLTPGQAAQAMPPQGPQPTDNTPMGAPASLSTPQFPNGDPTSQ